MKIAVLTNKYPSEKHLYSHMFVHTRCKVYQQNGHEVQIFIPSTNSEDYTFDGIPVCKKHVKQIIPLLDKFDYFCIHLLHPDIIPSKNSTLLYQHINKEKLPTLFFMHGIDTLRIQDYYKDERYNNYYGFLRFIYRDYILQNRFKKIVENCLENERLNFVFPSNWLKETSEKTLRISYTDKYKIIANGINTDLFQFEDQWKNRYQLLSIRPLLKTKKYAIDIIQRSMELLPDNFHCDLYGKGRQANAIKEMLGDTNKISLTEGFFNQKEIAELHRNYGCYFGATRMDTQGVSALEAMASGLLVISFDSTAVSEFITNERGILAPEDNINFVVEELLKVTNDKAAFQNKVEKGRNFCESIDIKITAKKELELIATL